MCYFRALQKGDINKVVPIDKSSTVLTILLALIFLHEGVTAGKLFSVVLIGLGTMLMITRKDSQRADTGQTETHWLLYAVLSAVFASLTAILGKIGISGVDSNLGTAIRTSVMLAMAWLIVFLKQKQNQVAARIGFAAARISACGVAEAATVMVPLVSVAAASVSSASAAVSSAASSVVSSVAVVSAASSVLLPQPVSTPTVSTPAKMLANTLFFIIRFLSSFLL